MGGSVCTTKTGEVTFGEKGWVINKGGGYERFENSATLWNLFHEGI